jgi:hypothetical protein
VGLHELIAAKNALFFDQENASQIQATWDNPYLEPLPANHKIPGLESIKKDAALRIQEEKRQKKLELQKLGIDQDDSISSVSDDLSLEEDGQHTPKS